MKYFSASLSISIATLLLWRCVVPIFFASPPDVNWIEQLYKVKTAYALSTHTPKVVTVGGSATHFGVNSQQLTTLIKQPSINFGIHGGLGIKYMLYRARQILKPGDTVVLLIEYGLYAIDEVTTPLTNYCFFYDPTYIIHCKYKSIPNFLFSYGVTDAIKTQINAYIRPYSTYIYADKTLTNAGDESGNSINKVTPAMLADVKSIDAFTQLAISQHAMSSTTDFINWCKAHHINVIASWPPVYYKKIYLTNEYVAFYKSITNFYQHHGVLVIGQPQNTMFALSDMLDTPYHLNNIGSKKYTQQLATALNQALIKK